MTARGVYRAKSQLFVLESRFLSTGHSTSTPRATTFLFRPPRKVIVSEQWVIFRAHPGIWPFRVIPTSEVLSTLNFGPSSTKLGGTVRAIIKVTHNDNVCT